MENYTQDLQKAKTLPVDFQVRNPNLTRVRARFYSEDAEITPPMNFGDEVQLKTGTIGKIDK
jgi:hypothetical protein